MGTYHSVISVTVTLLCHFCCWLFLKTQGPESLCAHIINLRLKGLKLKIFCIKKNNLPLSGYQMQICQQNMSDSFSITKYKFFLYHIQTFYISALSKSFSIGSSLIIQSLNCRHLCLSNVQVINLKTEILLSFSTSLSPGAEVMLML